MLLACDGIWDVLTNEEVVEFVRARVAQEMQPEVVGILLQRASVTREETTIATERKLILMLHLGFGPRTRKVIMTSQSKKNDFFSSGANL